MAVASRILLYCLILWAPLPLGSNRPIVWAINGLWASAILALFLAHELLAKARRQIDWTVPAWLLAGLTLWAVWIVIQSLPGMPPALAHPLWAEFAVSGGAAAISINPGSTLTTACQVVPAVFLAIVALRLAVDRSRARFLLNLIVVATVGVAVYGLTAQFIGFKQVFLTDSVAYEGFLTGTFVGRNAAATYFTIGLAAAAALFVGNFEARIARAEGSNGLLAAIDGFQRGAVYLVACLILIAAVLNTGSRGGFIACAIALLAVAAFWVGQTSVGTRAIFIAVGLVAVALGATFGTASGLLLERLEAGLGDGERFLAYLDTIDMIWARPWLGHGAGTFADAFPLFQERAPSAIVWNAAHNSYLQSIAELGIPVFTIVMICALGVLVAIVRGIFRAPAFPPVAVAAVSATLAVAFHSAVDFSVQFQAIGLTLAVLIGAGLGEVAVSPKRKVQETADGPVQRILADALAGLAPVRRETVHVAVDGAHSGRKVLPTARSSAPPLWAEGQPTPPTTAGKSRIYAFGDLHGRLDLLHRLRDLIAADLGAAPAGDALVIGLGDYIDRGPDAKAVVDLLLAGAFPCDSVFLRGNHEQMLLDFLEEPDRHGPMWFRFGATETLLSYGVNVRDVAVSTASRYRAIRDEFARRIDPAQLLFLQRLPTSFETATHFFAHAGARPGTPLGEQTPDDLLWMREGFADGDHPFEKIVVHGHTPVEKPYFGKYRINLDTGAYFTNRLSCLVIDNGAARVIDATLSRESELTSQLT